VEAARHGFSGQESCQVLDVYVKVRRRQSMKL